MTIKLLRNFVTVAMAAGLLACSPPDVPDVPTWAVDVQPILRANCIRCHGAVVAGRAPAGLRFDLFGESEAGADSWSGAGSISLEIASRAGHIVEPNLPMPPKPAPNLLDYQREILIKWGEALGPDDRPAKGDKPDNQPPTVRLLQPLPATAAGPTTIDLFAEDPDRDGVVGNLMYDGPGGMDVAAGIPGGGRHEVTWDPTGLDPGTYKLTAVVHDDFDPATIDIGTIDVP